MNSFRSKVEAELDKNSSYEWIEEEDRIYSDEDLKNQLKMENQLTFWRKNCDIRSAFKILKHEIEKSDQPSVRQIGWSEIARKSNCDRNTLKRPERINWVTVAREQLLNLVYKKLESEVEIKVVTTGENELKKLKAELEEIKTEAAKWFLKYETISRELSVAKDSLNFQIKVNKEISLQNVKLLKEINKSNELSKK